ncbi:GNAT family N-acetyltransferase [Aquabacter sp. CN5-332]|uniref:GNAT family N-acetyltransferase n=1 Tax=Aquabacter sp. CN5-332 TaxID=3156608 RepID=UPI0032B60800
MSNLVPVQAAVAGERIVPLAATHEIHWRALYRDYADFYSLPMSDDILARTWAWLMDGQSRRLEGLVAQAPDGTVVGLVHFRAVPDPLLGRDVGFLDDLFVSPVTGEQTITRRLIQAVADEGRRRSWPHVRWVTAPNNANARMLYDTLARATAWVTYELVTGVKP